MRNYLLIKFCSIYSAVFHVQVELLNFSEGFSCFLRNRNWVPAITADKEYKYKLLYIYVCNIKQSEWGVLTLSGLVVP